MIVSHRHKFIFIHVTKCAGTSVTRALAPYLGEDDLVLGCTPEGEKLSEAGRRRGGLHKHSSAAQARQVLGESLWNAYFKFSFVRNPWDLLVSQYHWWLVTPWDDANHTGRKVRELNDFEDYVLSPYRRRASCLDFLADSAGKLDVDFVGRQETLRWDFARVCRRLGLPAIELQVENRTRHGPYPGYYNPLTRDLVGAWFRADCTSFGYGFEDLSPGPGPAQQRRRDKPARLIVHCCHHRVATVWFGRVLTALAQEFGWKYQACGQEQLDSDTDIFLQNWSQVDLGRLPPYVGSHVIRDPRDIMVSAYFYHLWCEEPMITGKRPDLEGRSYQQVLNALPFDEGLALEIAESGQYIEGMMAWDYADPNIIEIRFEDLVRDPKGEFGKVFRKYGFDDAAVENGLRLVERFSFERMAGRRPGQEDRRHHFRRGVPGDWRRHFSDRHRRLFKRLYPGVLQRLGYETDDDW